MSDAVITLIILGSILLAFTLIHLLMTPRPRRGRRR